MSKLAAAGLFFGLAGFLLGAAAYYKHVRLETRMDGADEVSIHDDEMQGQFAARITALETRTGGGEVENPEIAEVNLRISALRKELTDGMNEVAEIRLQIAGLVTRLQALEKPK